MGDLEGALESFRWFDKTFPDDCGEPGQYLCWTLALHRAGRIQAARCKLGETMLQNLYLIPRLLGIDREPIETSYGSNWEWLEYLDDVPPEYFSMWDAGTIEWARESYENHEFQRVERRVIEINRALENMPVGRERSALVNEESNFREFWRSRSKDGKTPPGE